MDREPDHTSSPEALAYAFLHKEFSPQEERSIHFSDGETTEIFIETYEKNFLKKLVELLLTEGIFTKGIETEAGVGDDTSYMRLGL